MFEFNEELTNSGRFREKKAGEVATGCAAEHNIVHQNPVGLRIKLLPLGYGAQ